MTDVQVVAYGDQVHVYDADDPAAVVVHTVAVGANLDAELFRVTEQRWRTVQASGCLGAYEVADHRSDRVDSPARPTLIEE